MTAFAPADRPSGVRADPTPPSAHAHDDAFSDELDGYRVLLDAWLDALRSGVADAPERALQALARHVDEQRPRQLRRLCSPGAWFEPWLDLPVPDIGAVPMLPTVPGWMAAGVGLWRALITYRRQLDVFCGPYRCLGTRTLARLQPLAHAPDSVGAVYTLWRRCQQTLEAEIVRSASWPAALARVTDAAAALRAAHREWLQGLLGVNLDGAAQRAIGHELAALRRQLRSLQPPA